VTTMFRTYDHWKTTDDTPEPADGGYCDVCGKRADEIYLGTVCGIETFYCDECAEGEP
jgi:hypothetical protein